VSMLLVSNEEWNTMSLLGGTSLSSSPHFDANLDAVDAKLVEDSRLRGNLGGDLRGSLGFERHVGTFLLVVDGSFDFALGLQRRDDVLVLPANLVGEPSEDAEFAVRLEPEDAERRGNHVSLSLVIRRRDALVGAVALHRVLSAGQLVGQHTSDRLVQDPGRGPVMEGATLGVHQTPLAKVVHVFELVAVEASGDVDPFAPDNDDSLSLQQSLGDDGGETTQKMTTAIDDQRLGGETHLDTFSLMR